MSIRRNGERVVFFPPRQGERRKRMLLDRSWLRLVFVPADNRLSAGDGSAALLSAAGAD